MGKSRCALFELLAVYLRSLDMPANAAKVPPFVAWVVVPDLGQSNQVWEELMSFLPPELVYNYPAGFRQEDRSIVLSGTKERSWGRIEVKSAYRNDHLQTRGVDFMWITEAQEISQEAYERLLPCLRDPHSLGYAFYEGIPPLTRSHWFFRQYELGQSGAAGVYSKTATSFDNPYLGLRQLEEIEQDRLVMREASWRRMYLASFEEEAGYFKNIEACIAGDELSVPIEAQRYVAGLDLGRLVDRTVLFIGNAAQRQVVHRYAWDSDSLWPDIREGVAAACRTWGVERLSLDATGMAGDMFTQELQAMGLPVEPYNLSEQSRVALLEGLGTTMERIEVSFPRYPELLDELRAFEYRKQPSGRVRPDHPAGGHDDNVFALAFCMQVCDASTPVVAGERMHVMGRRYLPADDEMGAGGSQGARLMAERRSDRLRERMMRAGIPLEV